MQMSLIAKKSIQGCSWIAVSLDVDGITYAPNAAKEEATCPDPND
jgi:hypothetical protein